MRQVGWASDEEGSLGGFEVFVSVLCAGLKAGSFMMSGSSAAGDGEGPPSGVGIIGSAILATNCCMFSEGLTPFVEELGDH